MNVRAQGIGRGTKTGIYQVAIQRLRRHVQVRAACDLREEFMTPTGEVDLARETLVVELKERAMVQAVHPIIDQGFGDGYDIAAGWRRGKKVAVRRPIDEVRLEAEHAVNKPARISIP